AAPRQLLLASSPLAAAELQAAPRQLLLASSPLVAAAKLNRALELSPSLRLLRLRRQMRCSGVCGAAASVAAMEAALTADCALAAILAFVRSIAALLSWIAPSIATEGALPAAELSALPLALGALPTALGALAAAPGAPAAALGALAVTFGTLAAALGALSMALSALAAALGAPTAAPGSLPTALSVLAAALGAPTAALGALLTALCALAATPGPPPVHRCVGTSRGISFENGLKAGVGLFIQSDGVGGSSNVPCVSPSASTLGCSSPVLGVCPSISLSWAASCPAAFIPSSSVSPSMRIAAMRTEAPKEPRTGDERATKQWTMAMDKAHIEHALAVDFCRRGANNEFGKCLDDIHDILVLGALDGLQAFQALTAARNRARGSINSVGSTKKRQPTSSGDEVEGDERLQLRLRRLTFCTVGGPAFAALVIGAFGEWSDDLESFVGNLASMGARALQARMGAPSAAQARSTLLTGTGNGGGTRTDSDDDGNPDEWAEGAYHLRRETRFGIGA
ncbi:hypothetical protein T492DRAFT_859711, partial [Pavlovales sp. CCMP2436]